MLAAGHLVFLRLCREKGLIDQAQAEAAKAEAKRLGLSPSAVLVKNGLISESTAAGLHREVERALAPTSVGGFRIIEKLGQGAMGTVYRAEQVSLGREVALKVMSPHIASNQEASERFLREARVAAAINHPNVISIIDVGNDGGMLYMALELVAGGDAAQLARRFTGGMPEARALEIVRDCTHGLQAIYEARLVHRDIKPANIFIGRNGAAKLADLGLARSETGSDRMTTTGITVGTPAFMSPEQAAGGAVDIRTDIYALGATLFELTTGATPFSGANAYAVVAQVLVEPAPDARTFNRELSAATAELIATTLAKSPDDRFQTPLDLLRALETALAGVPVAAARPRQGGAATIIGKPTAATLAASPARVARAGRRSRRPGPRLLLPGLVALAAAVVVVTLRPGAHGPAPSAVPPSGVPPAPLAGKAPTVPAAAPVAIAPVAPLVKVAGAATAPAIVPATTPATVARAPGVAAAPASAPARPAWAADAGSDRFGSWADLTIATVTQRLRWIAPATFTMGAKAGSAAAAGDDPRHQVTLTQGFWLADSECTQELWAALMGTTPSFHRGSPQLPVEQVSWEDCKAFCARLAERFPALQARLPSIAQWEYACRAGADAPYWSGDDPERLVDHDNVADARYLAVDPHSKALRGDDGFGLTAPVRHYPPNPFGLYDLHGNVNEWNEDGAIPTNSTPAVDPLFVGGVYRNLSGGNYTSEADDCRASRHVAMPPEARLPMIGFRFLIFDRR